MRGFDCRHFITKSLEEWIEKQKKKCVVPLQVTYSLDIFGNLNGYPTAYVKQKAKELFGFVEEEDVGNS